MNEDKFVYIGRKSCNCAVAVTMDNGDAFTARHVAGFIMDGLTVEHVPWSEYRKIAAEGTFMNCPHGQLRMAL